MHVKRIAGFALLLLVFVVAGHPQSSPGTDTFQGQFTGSATSPSEPFALWYRRPAAVWTEALPIGNGRLGAMIFGGIEGERIQLNEDTLYAGGPYDPNNPDALVNLPEVRKLIFDGKYKQAADLIDAKMMAKPLKQMAYETVGDLLLRFPHVAEISDYRRDLDIDKAVARISYKVGDLTFTREVFSSAVDQVIMMRLTASKP